MKLQNYISDKFLALKLRTYRYIYIPIRVNIIRRKKIITVLFPIANLGAWKTESLYREMLAHPRFNPILVFTTSSQEDDRENLRQYAKERNYDYFDSSNPDISYWKDFKPDIIFYQKPYSGDFIHNLRSLFCYVPYAFHNSKESWAVKTPYLHYCWQDYYENETLAQEFSEIVGEGIKNNYGTGIPTMDELLIKKSSLEDPWKNSQNKKRIIYAPHHSIDVGDWWHSSTFLTLGEQMLELAELYSDKVQWAFKPHPLLRSKLENIWGKKKTDDYYDRWAKVEWSQFESGKYIELFKYSDAMIHDCGSFIEEYMYTGNPVMYLMRNDYAAKQTFSHINAVVNAALDLHEHGETIEDVELFIKHVINEYDPGRAKRLQFVNENLTPAGGQSSSRNIIESILSGGKFKAY